MVNSIFRLKFFIFLGLMPIHLIYAASTPQKLTTLLNRLQSLQANFTQTVMDGRGQILQKTSGKMSLQRPGRFRWEVLQPSKQLLIADGQRVWFYDVGLQQVMVQKQQPMSENSPAALLSDSPDHLTTLFDVKMAADSFYLTPKDKNALFSSITLIFKKNQLFEMRFRDKLAQQTVIHYSQCVLNPLIRKQVFQFILPKGENIQVVKG